MAISLGSLKRKEQVKPPIVVLHGVHGIGKTTFACGAPNPVVCCIEDGLGSIDVPHWSILSYQDMMDAIGVLYAEEHDRKTLVVDSLDWWERLVQAEACRRNGWATIEDPGYGKGYVAALDVLVEYLDGIKALRDEKGMTVVQIAHTHIKRFDSPDTEPYDRYVLKMHERSSAKVQEHADIVGFLNFRVSIKQTDTGFNKKVTRAVGGGQRVLYLEERPAFLAKNRYSLPSSVDIPAIEDACDNPDLAWAAFAQHLPHAG